MLRVFLLGLWLTFAAQAATYYVAKTGSDSNPGTSPSPFLTVQKGVDTARAGDTIVVGAGTYVENPRFVDFAGSAGSPITIDGQNVATVGSFTWEQPFIRIYNFAFNGKNLFNSMLYIAQAGSSCILSNCVLDPNNDPNITPVVRWNGPASAPFGAAGSDNLIISNIVKNVRGEMAFRIYGYRNVITGNYIHDIDNTDFFQVAGGTNYIVGNVCSNLYYSGLNPNNHADFIQIFGDAGGSPQASKGHLVESNIVVKVDEVAQLGNLTSDNYAYVTDLTFRNNLFVGISAKCSVSMPNVRWYNNTFINCATNDVNGGSLLIFGDVSNAGQGHGGQVFNNAFLNCGIAGVTNNNSGWYSFDTTLTNVAADYNYVGKDGYKAIDVDPMHRMVGAGGGWEKTQWWEVHGINGGDPKFVNESQLDFRLLAGSPLIGAALSEASLFTTDIRGVTRGGSWDMGAYEYQASDFNVYPLDVGPRLIQAYSTVVSNATTIIWPGNADRLELKISRRTFTNRPSAWPVWTNIYSNTSFPTVTNAATFTDTNFAGVHYEYEVSQLMRTNAIVGGAAADPNGYRDYQYLNAGYRVPLKDTRGNVILLVESGVASSLATELTQLKNDLIGDGYKFFRHDIAAVEATAGTSWTNAVWTTRGLLQTDYNSDTNTPWSVFIVGHVPVPYSGEYSPGSHDDNNGAHGTDLFYADLNGTFTDSTVNNTTAGAAFTHNIPGDGKFDQTYIPSTPEVRIGRVDLGNMPAFSSNATELLRQYLNRNHQWRHKQFTVRNRAIIYYGGDTNRTVDAKPLESNNLFAGYFGSTTAVDLGNWLPLSHDTNHTYLFSHKQGSGGIDHDGTDSVPELGTAANFAATNLYGVFTAAFGSYYGSWDSLNTNAFLKSVLCNGGYPLATWYHENYMQVNASAMDEPIGYELFASASGRFFLGAGSYYSHYSRIVPFGSENLIIDQHKMYESLMGDPTLRTHQVYPVSNLAVNASGSDNVLTWTASAEPYTVEGYHVYRAPVADPNSFTRLTTNPTTAVTYTDTGAAATAYVYMVRTVKLEDSPNRSFYNASQGIFVTSTASGAGANESISGRVVTSGRVVFQ